MSIIDLAKENVLLIVNYLDYSDLVNASKSSKDFYKVFGDSSIYGELYLKEFGIDCWDEFTGIHPYLVNFIIHICILLNFIRHLVLFHQMKTNCYLQIDHSMCPTQSGYWSKHKSTSQLIQSHH